MDNLYEVHKELARESMAREELRRDQEAIKAKFKYEAAPRSIVDTFDIPARFTVHRAQVAEKQKEDAAAGFNSELKKQFGGDHYKHLKHQPWEVLHEALTPEQFQGYMVGEAVAYLLRHNRKGGREGIEKAQHTLAAYLELTK